MEGSSRFDPSLADRVLPPPLLKSLRHIFAQGISDCLLVGGTALAGFYAGHRRSDDLDLFTGNAVSFRQTVLAVRSLRSIGVELQERSGSNQYYRAVCSLEDLSFTVDVVLDKRLLDIAETSAAGAVVVAGLPTLFAMKAAALVSRCSEKDLYDLLWAVQRVSRQGTLRTHRAWTDSRCRNERRSSCLQHGGRRAGTAGMRIRGGVRRFRGLGIREDNGVPKGPPESGRSPPFVRVEQCASRGCPQN